MRKIFLLIIFLASCPFSIVNAQQLELNKREKRTVQKHKKVIYGTASYYSDKFIGKKTANGSVFSQKKYTAACNVLPLGTWVIVTNLKNGKSVKVKTNDRLHPKMKRLLDLSKIAAAQLGYLNKGLASVKVEVLGGKLNDWDNEINQLKDTVIVQ